MKTKEKKSKPPSSPGVTEIPVIGPENRFYGYITGLGVGLRGENGHDRRCYAMFEYNRERTVWIIPDYELFLALGEYLNGMAYCRFETPDDYGYSKLYIGKTETGTWSVQTP